MGYINLSNEQVNISNGEVLFEESGHKFIWLGWDEADIKGGFVQVNQYLIISNGKGTLLDPGGVHVFPKVVANVSRYIDLADIKNIFYTHQDPDVSSGIAMWLSITSANVYISKLWVRFLPHFGITDVSRIIPIEDNGGRIDSFEAIPAHFMHSPGQHTLYDPTSKILFTGDVGAAVFGSKTYLFVEDFNAHVALMEGFHKRYMASNAVCRNFVNRVRKYDINMIAPQHGSIFKKEAAKSFLSWLESLKCGSDIIDEISR